MYLYLSSSIIEYLKNRKKGHVAYFFFDGRGSRQELQLHHQLLRSLIIQLAGHCGAGIPLALVDLHKQCGNGHQEPSLNDLQGALQLILKENFPLQTYIVIDALDECTEQEKTLKWIKEIEAANLHLIVTSRPLPNIATILENLDWHYVDMAKSKNVDIAAYIDLHVGKLGKWNEETQKNIQLVLIKGAQGM